MDEKRLFDCEERKIHESRTLNNDQIVALIGGYKNEWEHRDELLWT